MAANVGVAMANVEPFVTATADVMLSMIGVDMTR